MSDFETARAENMQLPASLTAGPRDSIFLKYQSMLFTTVSQHALTVCEKSRRIGATWSIAAFAVLTSAAQRTAGGMDSLYIGYNYEMAREFIDAAAMFAKAFLKVGAEVGEFLFDDQTDDGETRQIKAFRISFGSGFEIVALSSKPRSLRGKQGFVIIDEAAFHDSLDELLKAALALLMWGGRVLVISTHDGDMNPFNELIQQIRAGKRKGKVLRITFDDAISDGLYERIAMIMHANGRPIAPKDEWIADIRASYGDAAEEELDVIPRTGSGAFLPLTLIERASDAAIPVIRLKLDDQFAMASQAMREAYVRDWCRRELDPLLDAIDRSLVSYVGEDFGRVGDLTVIWPLLVDQATRNHTPFVAELRNVPFEQQRQILFHIFDRLPRFSGAALDKGGNGAYLAEVALQRYGSRIEGIAFSAEWYREQMPPFKAAFDDDNFPIPADRDIQGDLRLIKMEKGIARVPDARTQGTDKGQRHGDAAIAAALANYASRRDPVAYGYEALKNPNHAGADDGRLRMRVEESEDDGRGRDDWRPGAW